MEVKAKSFPTKNGYCHIYTDRLEEERNDFSGKLYTWLSKKGIKRAWFLYFLLLFVLIIAAAISYYVLENYFLAIFFATAAVMDLFAIWRNRNIFISPIVPRNQIQSVIYHQAVPGVSRASFEVFFKPKKRIQKKFIYLPLAQKGGKQVAQSVYYMMKEEGLIKDQ